MQRTLKATGSSLIIAVLAAFGSTPIFAADPIEHQVQLIASIPSTSFYVAPADSGWIGQAQLMEWTADTSATGGKLTAINKAFDVKNSSGAISARLSDEDAYLYNGAEKIDLNVTFNDKKLTTSAAEVISADDAKTGKRVTLLIAAVAATKPYAPGSYSGIVNMTFDAVPPVAR